RWRQKQCSCSRSHPGDKCRWREPGELPAPQRQGSGVANAPGHDSRTGILKRREEKGGLIYENYKKRNLRRQGSGRFPSHRVPISGPFSAGRVNKMVKGAGRRHGLGREKILGSSSMQRGDGMTDLTDNPQRIPQCLVCGADLEQAKRGGAVHDRQMLLGFICQACVQSGARETASRARQRAAANRALAEQGEKSLAGGSLAGVPRTIREYAHVLDGLADRLEKLQAWPEGPIVL